jgi:hypothetical protein
MAIQIVMDRTGDSRHPFDPNDAQELAKAEQRFYELTKVGFLSFALEASSSGPLFRSWRLPLSWVSRASCFIWNAAPAKWRRLDSLSERANATIAPVSLLLFEVRS